MTITPLSRWTLQTPPPLLMINNNGKALSPANRVVMKHHSTHSATRLVMLRGVEIEDRL